MAELKTPPGRKSWLIWSVLIGSATLAVAGALYPHPPDFTLVSGAIYGFLLGAIAGVVADRVRSRAAEKPRDEE
jgi:ABC-type enterobactin transport system permease subunit